MEDIRRMEDETQKELEAVRMLFSKTDVCVLAACRFICLGIDVSYVVSILLCVFGQLLMDIPAPLVILLCRPMHFKLLHAVLCQAGSGCKVNISDVTKSRMSALTTSLFVVPYPSHKVPFSALLLLLS